MEMASILKIPDVVGRAREAERAPVPGIIRRESTVSDECVLFLSLCGDESGVELDETSGLLVWSRDCICLLLCYELMLIRHTALEAHQKVQQNKPRARSDHGPSNPQPFHIKHLPKSQRNRHTRRLRRRIRLEIRPRLPQIPTLHHRSPVPYPPSHPFVPQA